MTYGRKCAFAFISALFLHLAASQSFNPTILQDSRDLPKVDGTFGFLYRTEDGIAHAAKGDANGVIHGRFSYTDPTGLKVNYNYNAGSRVAPGYKEQPQTGRYQASKVEYQPQPRREEYQPQPRREEYRQPQYEYDDGQYVEEPQYVPQSRPSARAQGGVTRTQYHAQYRQPESYRSRARPQYSRQNEVYDDYSN